MKSKLFIITAITEASKTTFFTNGAEKISSSGKSKLFIHQPITPAGCEKGVDAKKVCVIDKRRWDFIIFA